MEDQTAPVPVTDRMLDAWIMMADDHVAFLRLGEVNWVMMVRSLVAEIRRLKSTIPN